MRSIGRVAAVTTFVVLVASAAAGCGSSGSSGGGDSGPIKLGQLASLTGNYAPLGTNDKLGAAQAVKEINDAGGLLGGRQLELAVKDDGSAPDQAVIAFNNLASSGVAAMVGSSFSNSSLAVIPLAERQKVTYVSTAASDEQVDPVRPYTFMTPPTAGAVAEQLLKYFKAQGMTKMAVAVDTKNAFAVTGWKKMSDLAGKYGVEFVTQETFETSTTDFSAVFTHVRGTSAQGLMVWTTGAPAVTITKQFATAGLKMGLVMSHAEASTLYTQPSGVAANGVTVASSLGVVGPDLPDSTVKTITQKMAQPFQQANGYYPPQFGLDGYNAVQIIAAGITKAGSIDSAKIQKAVEGLSLVSTQGEYKFSPKDHSGLTSDDVVISVVKDGNFVPTPWSKLELSRTLK